MTLETGTRLGHYEILGILGAGGMGEVYKANDTRLDRVVAVKVLPEHLARSEERRERFAREAKTISQLNHPHICTLHDAGSHKGVDFLVMEYIEGETLAERLERGALPLDKAVEVATQMCGGLDEAHRNGVVHRDLKPGNVMLTRAGVKILDFGLAKFFASAPVSESSDAPTRQQDLTREQTIVGTLPYMAPEQLEGQGVDERVDIWALGAILHEMLTGERTFRGDTQASLISAILNARPAELPAPALDYIVSTCLAKDRDERWRSAGDVGRQLRGATASDSPLPELSSRRHTWVAPAAVAFVVGTVVTMWMRPIPELPEPAPSRFDIGVPGAMPLYRAGGRDVPVAVSPDGRTLAFVTYFDGTAQLYLRDLDSFDARAVNNSANALNPFFSPSGRWLGFRVGNVLWKVSVDDGVPLEIVRSETTLSSGAAWVGEDTIVFSPDSYDVLYRVSAAGGETAPLTTKAPGESGHQFPTALPGGKHVLFTVRTDDGWFAAVASLDTGEHRILMPAEGFVRYLPPGYLVHGKDGALRAIPFDLETLEVRGGAIPVLDNVRTGNTANIDVANFTVSESGVLVYVAGGVIRNSLFWVDRQGRKTLLSREMGRFAYPSLSPDATRLAVTDNADVWVYDLEAETRTRLTSEGFNFVAKWSRDGARVVFGSSVGNSAMSLTEMPVDGTERARSLLERPGRQYPIAWSRDSSELLFFERGRGGGDIMAWSPAAGGEPAPVRATEFRDWSGRLSPDGRLLAYASDATGRDEVYIQPYPGPGRTVTVSTEGGAEPLWSRDGRELFYRDGPRVMAVDVSGGRASSVGRPHFLFEGSFNLEPCCGANYDVDPDGRFVMIEAEGGRRVEPSRRHELERGSRAAHGRELD